MAKNSVKRLHEIISVLTSYGFGFIVDKTLKKGEQSPENLRKSLEELGPTFIKIGQILSTRPDILPARYIEELSKLQDSVPPESLQDINDIFFEEFGLSTDEAFLLFEKEPLASASISQVHKAVTWDKQNVIVKIQRPMILEKMNLDLKLLKKIVSMTKSSFKDSLIDPIEAIEEIEEATAKELNFIYEANHIIEFKKLNSNNAFVNFPNLYHELCSQKILTMENIDGIKIDNITDLNKKGENLDKLAENLGIAYGKQIFIDGYFHGDPHPGNILVHNGIINFIDFGIVGELPPYLRESLNDLIISMASKDPGKAVSVLLSMGIKRGPLNKNSLYEDIEYLFDLYLSAPLRNIRLASIIQEIFTISKNNNLKMPKELILLARALLIIEGVMAKISPDTKLVQLVVPFIKSQGKKHFIDKIDLEELFYRGLGFGNHILEIPGKIVDISNSMLSGRTKIKLEIHNLSKHLGQLNKMANRLVFSMIVSAMILSSSIIIAAEIGPKFQGISIIGISGYSFAAFLGIWLMISILRSGRL